MSHRLLRAGLRMLSFGALAATAVAQTSVPNVRNDGSRTATAAAPNSRTARPTGARGPLPDPVLLDGSTHAAEKRPEYGMIGDFEMPGDEMARNERVGGGPGSPQGGEQQQQQGGSGGSMASATLPSGGGPQGQQQQAAAQPPQGSPINGQGDPNAKPEGMQVGQLQTDPNAGQGDMPMPNKPPPVTIGDSAMQIQTTASSANAVGTAPAGQTQQMEKEVGGGRGSTTIQSGPGNVERGRAIPAGL